MAEPDLIPLEVFSEELNQKVEALSVITLDLYFYSLFFQQPFSTPILPGQSHYRIQTFD